MSQIDRKTFISKLTSKMYVNNKQNIFKKSAVNRSQAKEAKEHS